MAIKRYTLQDGQQLTSRQVNMVQEAIERSWVFESYRFF